MMFTAGWTSGGCSSASGLHKAAAAADVIGSSLQTAEGINHDAETQGVESIAERDAVASYILQATQANDAFVAAINSAEQSGTTTVPQSVVSAQHSCRAGQYAQQRRRAVSQERDGAEELPDRSRRSSLRSLRSSC